MLAVMSVRPWLLALAGGVLMLPTFVAAQPATVPEAVVEQAPATTRTRKARQPKDPDAPKRAPKPRGTTYIRVLHAIPSAGPIDVFVDGGKKAEGIGYKSLTEYLSLPSGSRTLALKKSGTDETLASIKKSGQADKFYVLAAVMMEGKPSFIWQNEVAGKPRAGRASVRVYNLAADSPAVRVTAPAVRGKNKVRNLVKELPFGKSRAVSLAPGTATLQVRNGEELLKDAPAEVEVDKRYAAFAVGSANALEIIVKPVGK
jgi:hypothetical protein